MHDDRHYSQENILIHEFGHSVMSIGMTEQQRQGVQAAYDSAKQQNLYHPGCYSMEVRADVTREGRGGIQEHVPLASSNAASHSRQGSR